MPRRRIITCWIILGMGLASIAWVCLKHPKATPPDPITTIRTSLTGKKITYQPASWEVGWTEDQYEAIREKSEALAQKIPYGKISETARYAATVLSDPAYRFVYVPGIKMRDGDPLYDALYDQLTNGEHPSQEDLSLLLSHESGDVRGLGVLVACACDHTEIPLRLAQKDPDPLVRALAVQGLFDFPPKPLSRELGEVAGDSSPLVRLAVANGLARLHDLADPTAATALRRLLKDSEAHVKAAAVMTARKIMGDANGAHEIWKLQFFGTPAEYHDGVERAAHILLEKLGT